MSNPARSFSSDQITRGRLAPRLEFKTDGLPRTSRSCKHRIVNRNIFYIIGVIVVIVIVLKVLGVF
jgi:hypothetical protein